MMVAGALAMVESAFSHLQNLITHIFIDEAGMILKNQTVFQDNGSHTDR